MEEKEIEIPTFRPIKVFDYAQTEGKPLPQLAADLFGNVQHYEAFMEALRRTSPVPLTIEPMQDNMDGFFQSRRPAHRHPARDERGPDRMRLHP